MVHPDAICWEKTILVNHFRYDDLSSSLYWNTHERAERRALSALGGFVPYNLMCAFNLTEATRDWCLMHIPATYDTLQACHGYKFDQEPVFPCRSSAIISNAESELWVVAYTERLLHLYAAVLMVVYGE